MDFDINTLRGIGTVFALIAFVSICFWAYNGKNKKHFEEAGNLPFADDFNDGEETQP